jgi:hypothetical protein
MGSRKREQEVAWNSTLGQGFAAGGCSGAKGWQTDGPAPASADGSARADAPASDTPLHTGGAGGSGGIFGSGGAIAYDVATGRGGSGGTGGITVAGSGGAPGLDANTSVRDAALGGAVGDTQVTGGSGSGGRTGSGGAAPGSGGRVVLDGAVVDGGKGGFMGGGGAVGSGGSGAGGIKIDAAERRDAAWWANDAGMKTCPYSSMAGVKCGAGIPSTCVIAGTYDTYQCNPRGVYVRLPDSCPGLLKDGDQCVGKFWCLYPSYWYCDCSAGMGFPAKCGDARDLGILDPYHPPDAPTPPTPPCSADVQQGASCDRKTQRWCARSSGIDLCNCIGTWQCPTASCPASVDDSTPCDAAAYCLAADRRVCECATNKLFICGFP